MIEKMDKYFSRIATGIAALVVFIGVYSCCDTNYENQKGTDYSKYKPKKLDLVNYDPKERCIRMKGKYKDGTCHRHFRYSWKDGFLKIAESRFGACKDVKITTNEDYAKFEGVCGKKNTKIIFDADYGAKTCAEKCPKCTENILTERGDCLHVSNEEAEKDICLHNYLGAKYDGGVCYVKIQEPVDITKAQSIFDKKFGACSTYGVSAPDSKGFATWRGSCGIPSINMNIKFRIKGSRSSSR